LLEDRCEIKPPKKLVQNVETHFPISIGDFVSIGSGSLIEASSIASQVVIGENVKVGAFSNLKEGCVILPGSIVPPYTTCPPWSIFGGVPATQLDEVDPNTIAERQRRYYYDHFIGK
jgi:dynactin-5